MPKKNKSDKPFDCYKKSVQGHACHASRDHIEGVGEASCFFCLRRFKADKIQKWVDDGMTAVCPFCGIDAVVAGKVDKSTLMRWHAESFK